MRGYSHGVRAFQLRCLISNSLLGGCFPTEANITIITILTAES